jgi:hypothetical protein
MADALTIVFPPGSAPDDAALIETALSELSVVESAQPIQARFDPASVALFVKLAGSVLGVVGTAVPIIQKIVATIRGKGVKGVVIEFSNGGKLSIDQASAADIERLIRAARV